MKKVCALLVAAASLAVPVPSAQPAAAPDIRLVLLIAVDQFRYDYLTRFRSEYTAGFKRLLSEGAVFTNANLEHYPTVTAVGHATMLTGATPA
jgi:predicted AlkP superfamily pyrophosphatase or phosphodiesterase